MRKLLLLSSIAMCIVTSNAQVAVKDNSFQRSRLEETPVVMLPNNNTHSTQHSTRSGSRSVSNHVKLNSQRIGSAGNLLTVNNGNANQIDVNDSLGAISFIHRNDNTLFGGTVSTYRFDLSRNSGNTWQSDLGPLNAAPFNDNVLINCRFPQGGIYNPIGNTIIDSAYQIYAGTWHNGTDGWKGEARGRGYLSGDSSTFNFHLDSVNHGGINVATGFCHGAPGVFWNITQDYPTNSFVSGTNIISHGIIIEKGVWDDNKRDIVWTDNYIPQAFATNDEQTQSEVTSLNIAFDPTGQFGWAVCLGDIKIDNEETLNPIFWQTTDGGNTWSAPTQVLLDSMQEVMAQLSTKLNTGDPASTQPTTAFDEDLVVDYLGHPHLAVIVGNAAANYSIEQAQYSAWDITFNPSGPGCSAGWHGWKGNYLGHVETLRGTLSNDNPAPETEDNRPMASASADGKKVFFFWLDSDINFIGADQNDLPNIFTKAYDLEHYVSTKTFNLTIGDSLWGGETSTSDGGVFGGAPFGTVSPIAHQNGTTYNVPLVLTQIDYNHDPSLGLGSYLNPCAFWYINNVNFDTYDFTEGLSASLILNGSDSVQVLLDSSYVDEGATLTYGDTLCFPSGTLHLVVDSSGVNYNQLGNYLLRYFAEDDSGVIYAGVVRVIEVGRPPQTDFTFNTSNPAYKIQFHDASQFGPTTWAWNFGDSHSAITQNPLHTYPNATATYHVCLTTTNNYGASTQFCKDVSVASVAVNDVELANSITMFPNPTTGKVNLNLNENTGSEIYVSVVDLMGQTVVSPVKYQSGTNHIEMDLNSLSSGVYLVKINATDKGIAIKQLTLTK